MRNILLIIFCFLAATRASAETLYIAAASNLVYCLEELNVNLKQQYPQAQLKVTIGSSGHFFAQIQQNAPYEVYLSADVLYPKQLSAESMLPMAKLYVCMPEDKSALWTNKPQNVTVSQGLVDINANQH